MSDNKEVKGKFRYEQDSKRYHRFKIETEEESKGSVYIPKSNAAMQNTAKAALESHASW